MIKAILFDVGGTLIKPTPSIGAIYHQEAKKFGIDIPADILDEKFKMAWKQRRESQDAINKNFWKDIIFEVFKNNSQEKVFQLFESLYAIFEKPDVWEVRPSTRSMLQSLQKKEATLYVASNWDERLPKLLQKLNLAHFFKEIFYSYELQVSKPNPKFFKIILNHLNLNAKNVLHIGDHPVEDIQCAQSVGINAVLINQFITSNYSF